MAEVGNFEFIVDKNTKAAAAKLFRGKDDFAIPITNVSGTSFLVTSTTLGADATFTQDAQDRLGDVLVSYVRGVAYADQAGTLKVEETDDTAGTWTEIASIAVSTKTLADTGYLALSKRYYRFRYINGATAQGDFALYQALRFGEFLDVDVASLCATNFEGEILASASRTANGTSADITIPIGSKLAVFLDVTAATGTNPTLDVVVQTKDPVSGKYFSIGTFTQKTGVGSEAIFIGGGADTEFATKTIRVEYTLGGTDPDFTFSVGYAVGL